MHMVERMSGNFGRLLGIVGHTTGRRTSNQGTLLPVVFPRQHLARYKHQLYVHINIV